MADIFTNGRFDAVTMANNHSLRQRPGRLGRHAVAAEFTWHPGDRGRPRPGGSTAAGHRRAKRREGRIPRILLGRSSRERGRGQQAGYCDRTCQDVLRNTRSARARPDSYRTGPEASGDAGRGHCRNAARGRCRSCSPSTPASIRLPRVVSDYQVAVAHAAIDAGADLVVGHAPHIPKAIEIYKGKAIFYSIGVFAMTKGFPAPSWREPAWSHGAVRNNIDLDPQYPFMPYGKPCTLSLLAKAVVSKGGVKRVSFLPMSFDQRYRPEVLPPERPAVRGNRRLHGMGFRGHAPPVQGRG